MPSQRATTIHRAWGVLERVQTSALLFKKKESSPSSPSCKQHEIFRLFLKDDGVFPNNSHHPLLLFRSAFVHGEESQGSRILTQASWTPPWVWGIYPYHHYHSTAWEILVCIKGQANVQLGGPAGPAISLDRGDVVLIPPGVAHKQLNASHVFALLGSYLPGSGHVDVLKGKPTNEQRQNIAKAPVPEQDPITGIRLQDLY